MSKAMPPEQGPPPPPHANVLIPAALLVERAAGDFRRGAPVFIANGGEKGEGGGAVAAAVETLNDDSLSRLRRLSARRSLLLTHARAGTLKIRLYTKDVAAIPVPADARAEELRAIADPTADLSHPLKGPFAATREALPNAAAASVKLAKLAGLLPAALLFSAPGAPSDLSQISAPDIAAFDTESARTLMIVGRARVPLEGAEDAELVAFRPVGGGPEHYAVVMGTPEPPVLARIHSECFTGDLLGSLRCDCGQQLRGAIAAIAKSGGGVLLYLAQEGRGIGLMNKLRAYRLQDEGFDTMEANERLGFAADERMYDIAARMLRLLGFDAVRLMTNNPDKVAALEAAGIEVAERVPHAFPSTEHNKDYLRAKKEKGGHLL